MSYSLGIDSSTQSCSAIVIDPIAGNIIAEASVNFGASLPEYNAPSGFIPDGADGEVHSDPRMWLDALELLLSDLATRCDLAEVTSISGAGQQHGSVYLNEIWFDQIGALTTDDSLSNQLAPCLSRSTSPIWMDTSTGKECLEIAEAVGGNAQVCAKSGSIAIERFTGPQIRRFYKTAPEAYENTARIHLVSSFLCSVLCGADAPIDTGDGAGMNLLNISEWHWDQDLLEATAPGLSERLPSVAQGSSSSGTISPYFCEKFGFTAGTDVTVFTGDNPSSLIGMGASQPGKLVISLGTSDTFFAAMPGVVADPEGCGHVFGNPAGGSMSLQCFINGSLARENVKDRFNYDWEAFTAALESTQPGNGSNLMIPFFRPEISPRVDLPKPKLQGNENFTTWKNADAAIRACVEGQFINMKRQSEWMKLDTEVIYLTGGASQNNAIAQVVADVFQAKVERLQVSGSVALGAALRAAEHTHCIPLAKMATAFCKTDPKGSIAPNLEAKSIYATASNAFGNLLNE